MRVVLRDASGAEVASGPGASGVLSVPDVHRWAPGDGYLYDLEVQLVDGGEVVDSYHQPVGVRTVEVRGAEFLVNGEPVYFKGFGKHEDVGVIGKGHSDAHLVHDFELMSWIGANSFRTSHYPYSEEVLDYADQQGFLLIDEVAAVGLNMGLGGGIFGGQGYTTFSPETINDATREVHAQAIRELIARDKNHPSVVLWSVPWVAIATATWLMLSPRSSIRSVTRPMTRPTGNQRVAVSSSRVRWAPAAVTAGSVIVRPGRARARCSDPSDGR